MNRPEDVEALKASGVRGVIINTNDGADVAVAAPGKTRHAVTHSCISEHRLDERLRMFDRLQRARHLGFWHSVPCFSGRGDGDVCTIVCIDDDPSDTTGLEPS
ncbi:hypothetical protein, partial [Agrobacterium tumefaciens]|uniref:hypothetical protein n=1 Tax=Agrobacterium tumefaciens TaxID=358 RepID=UPI0015746C99|nr:hypothetical protein [Agrobacterium tumefaciens]